MLPHHGERSTSKHNLRYSNYYGDGDTKGFSDVKDIYYGITVSKKECIGQVQKRVGNRFRKLKKSVKGFGNLGLNDACIYRLQNYYGIAIRSNVGDLPKMH